MKIPKAALAILASVFAASCAPLTPAQRISMSPGAFASLGEKEKELVSDGQIAEGMGMAAVMLAWGDPSSKVDGLRDGRPMERWNYHGTRPVMTSGLFTGNGAGIYGPYRDAEIHAGFGPEVIHQPYLEASVWFVDGKVSEWERVR